MLKKCMVIKETVHQTCSFTIDKKLPHAVKPIHRNTQGNKNDHTLLYRSSLHMGFVHYNTYNNNGTHDFLYYTKVVTKVN
jgi:hypothetical protein